VAFLKSIAPLVFLACEVGTPANALWYSHAFAKAKVNLVRAPHGGKWRYGWYDPTRARLVASGLFIIPTKYKGDEKQAFWMVLEILGHRWLFMGAHLENEGPESYRIDQAKDTIHELRRVRAHYDVDWSRVLYAADTNGKGGVQDYLESTELTSAIHRTKNVQGTGWTSQTRWLPRRGSGRKATKTHPSMDWMGVGGNRRLNRFLQSDEHTISDHDPLTGTLLAID
jgi:hypothetical protein